MKSKCAKNTDNKAVQNKKETKEYDEFGDRALTDEELEKWLPNRFENKEVGLIKPKQLTN